MSIKHGKEGYVYVSYGKVKYLAHVIASVVTLRRHDTERPVAIVCPQEHIDILIKEGLDHMFAVMHPIGEEHCSIVGFKHHLDKFLFFDKNIFIDSDIVWCKNPNTMWKAFSPYSFTITGTQTADIFFGAAKGVGVLKNFLFKRRERTLKNFGLTYLSRVQSGVIYAEDEKVTKEACESARYFLDNIDKTHFKTRLSEKGRSMESCEWSLAMAMSKLDLPVYPWFNGQSSMQLDYISNYTTHDDDFTTVKCKYYCNSTVYSLRGIGNVALQNLLTNVLTIPSMKGDAMDVTPYCLHFGWLHEKQPFLDFADMIWDNRSALKLAIK